MKQIALFENDSRKEADKSIYSKTTAKNLIYEPSLKKPNIHTLVDICKSRELEKQILESGVTQEEKNFLILAAYRHNGFNYDLIADYYSHASAEMQALMESSGLVILDFEKAIENGFVQMSENISNHYSSEK